MSQSETSAARERLLRLFGHRHDGFYACYSELAQTSRRGPPPGTLVVPGIPTTSVSRDAGDYICNTTTYGRPIMTDQTNQAAPEAEDTPESYVSGAEASAFFDSIFGGLLGAGGRQVLLRVKGLGQEAAIDLIRKPLNTLIDHPRDDGRTVEVAYDDGTVTVSLVSDRPASFSIPLGIVVMGEEPDPVAEMSFMLASISILSAIEDDSTLTLDDLQTMLPGAPADLYESVVATFVDDGLIAQDGDEITTATFSITLRGRIMLVLSQDYDSEPKSTYDVANAVDLPDDPLQVEKILLSLEDAGSIYRLADSRWSMRAEAPAEAAEPEGGEKASPAD